MCLAPSLGSAQQAGQPAPYPTMVGAGLEEPYPDLLDYTLSGKGDVEEDNSPHSGFLRLPTALEDWFAFKQRLTELYGLTIGGSYGVLWQHYSSSPIDERNSVGGKFTFNLSYEITSRGYENPMWLEAVVEDRRPLGTELPPLFGGLAAGSMTPTAATWGEFDLGVTQFYLRQNLFNNRVQYAIGKLFAPNFVNPYPFFDDNRQFFNQAFTTSPTIPVPLRGFGLVGAAYPTDGGLYVKAGMYTTKSDDTGFTIDEFFNTPEHFYHVEVGWTSLAGQGVPLQARGPMDANNVHVTAWHKDDEKFGPPEANGVAFNANFKVREDVMVFLRGGVSEGWVIDRNLSAGFGWRPFEAYSDLFGLGIGWAQPSNDALRDQYVMEAFYRWHLTPNLAFTPNVKMIVNPALYPTEDTLWVFGLRGRLTF
jgi:hypothetical protein